MGNVIAMYDVTGIQDYIFRTSKMRDAIGASAIVENIIGEALQDAAAKETKKLEYKWDTENGPLEYKGDDNSDIKVLYIGGGNAYVEFSDMETARSISKRMAKYTMDKTYSLQLAVALSNKTGNYKENYKKLNDIMTDTKAKMIVSRPVGALPVMQVEVKTGYPITNPPEGINPAMSTESKLKLESVNKVRSSLKKDADKKKLESYIEDKGTDSMLAVVHIDGNNMGQRIKALIEDITDYTVAVNKMRNISHNINYSFKKVFEDMQDTFNNFSFAKTRFENKTHKDSFVMKVITAGDDITYVCTASIALATVEYFCKRISQLCMYQVETSDIDLNFSACAGISYFNSHFPFNIAYDVAEECCDSAKKRAKKNKVGDRIGNWVDFQFCRNIQARNLDRIRNEEYITSGNLKLLRRPYYISVDNDEIFDNIKKGKFSYDEFCKDMVKYVLDTENNIPHSYVKELRNTYPLGEKQVSELCSFLKSRNRDLPDEMFFEDTCNIDSDENDGKTQKIALLYDALEVSDYFMSVEDMKKED